MSEYSQEEQERIVQEYFSAQGSEAHPRCPHCGELLKFHSTYPAHNTGFEVRISCPECAADFVWKQTQPEQSWKPLHLDYFIERYQFSNLIRCPVDDCCVTCTEFSDGILEFRCPYCNRRGKVQRPLKGIL